MATAVFETGIPSRQQARVEFNGKARTFRVNVLRGYSFRLDPVTFGFRIIHQDPDMFIGDVLRVNEAEFEAESGHFVKRTADNPYIAAAKTLCAVMYHERGR